jgi:hypothetical protein
MDNYSDSDGDMEHFGVHMPAPHFGGGGIDRPFGSDEERSASTDEEDEHLMFHVNLQRVQRNDPFMTELYGAGYVESIQNMTDEEWQEMGQDIANNTYLEKLLFNGGALNDHKMSFLFRGLTRSSTIDILGLFNNGLSVTGVRSMVPFLHHANSLRELDLDNNNIKSEGFNVLFRALRDSPIEELSCDSCGIESTDIDRNSFPKHLKSLCLSNNMIDASGCLGLATLLEGGDATVTNLWLSNNKIDDEGVAILVDVLENNTSMEALDLKENDDISIQGQIMCLQLVNDISSIKATLQSNHTLTLLHVKDINLDGIWNANEVEIQNHIDMATRINKSHSNPESAGSEKVIVSHLQSQNRADLCDLQEVDHSVYSEIDPLHLPEVLSLIDRRHGQGELYVALLSSIMTLFSTVNREKCIQQQREYYEAKIVEYRAKIEELDAELATMKGAAGRNQDDMDSKSNKRRRI